LEDIKVLKEHRTSLKTIGISYRQLNIKQNQLKFTSIKYEYKRYCSQYSLFFIVKIDFELMIKHEWNIFQNHLLLWVVTSNGMKMFCVVFVCEILDFTERSRRDPRVWDENTKYRGNHSQQSLRHYGALVV